MTPQETADYRTILEFLGWDIQIVNILHPKDSLTPLDANLIRQCLEKMTEEQVSDYITKLMLNDKINDISIVRDGLHVWAAKIITAPIPQQAAAIARAVKESI